MSGFPLEKFAAKHNAVDVQRRAISKLEGRLVEDVVAVPRWSMSMLEDRTRREDRRRKGISILDEVLHR